MAEEDYDSKIFVRSLTYQTGGLTKSASKVGKKEFEDLESALLCIPDIPVIPLQLSKEHFRLMAIMMDHVTIQSPIQKHYVHVDQALIIARKYIDQNGLEEPGNLSLDRRVEIIERYCRIRSELKCTCEGHVRIMKENWVSEERDFEVLLAELQVLDTRNNLKDHSGVQVMVGILNFLAAKQGWRGRCSSKSATLQTSCALYNQNTNTLQLYNSTPDFVYVDSEQKTNVVGEIESSPFVQMLIASIGHVADASMRFMVGVCVSKDKSVNLYLVEKDINIVIHSDQVYTGSIKVKSLSLYSYSLIDSEKLEKCLEKIANAMNYIADDYERRLANIPDDMTLIHESPNVIRKSERKRKREAEDKV